jgi:hypothetical protein
MGSVRRIEYRELCPRTDCHLWPYRLGQKPSMVKVGPLRAIRKHCLECAGGTRQVELCSGKLLGDGICPLHEYRFGRNPKLKGKGHGREAMQKVRQGLAHGRGEPQKTSKPSALSLGPGVGALDASAA